LRLAQQAWQPPWLQQLAQALLKRQLRRELLAVGTQMRRGLRTVVSQSLVWFLCLLPWQF
jgi:hypothetical protein